MNQIKIVVDERERGKIRSEFKKLPCNIQIETMDVSDYLISQDFAIERKRGDDLTSSICDNRFFSQLLRMKKYYPQSLIVLENPHKAFARKGVLEQSIYGAMIYSSYSMGIPIIPTQSEEQTAQVIFSFAKYTQSKLPKPFIYQPLNLNDNMVGQKEQLDFLEGLFKVARTKAETLLDYFKTPDAIIKAILTTEILKTSGGNIKGIDGPLSELKGFGPSFVLTNKRLLQLPFSATQNLPINILTK